MGRGRKRGYTYDTLKNLIEAMVFTPIIAKALFSHYAKKRRNEYRVEKESDYDECPTIGLNENELKIIKGLKILNGKYNWQDVADIQRAPYCEQSECRSYKIFFHDGHSMEVTIAKKLII
jgi:hypothetical protein